METTLAPRLGDGQNLRGRTDGSVEARDRARSRRARALSTARLRTLSSDGDPAWKTPSYTAPFVSCGGGSAADGGGNRRQRARGASARGKIRFIRSLDDDVLIGSRGRTRRDAHRDFDLVPDEDLRHEREALARGGERRRGHGVREEGARPRFSERDVGRTIDRRSVYGSLVRARNGEIARRERGHRARVRRVDGRRARVEKRPYAPLSRDARSRARGTDGGREARLHTPHVTYCLTVDCTYKPSFLYFSTLPRSSSSRSSPPSSRSDPASRPDVR